LVISINLVRLDGVDYRCGPVTTLQLNWEPGSVATFDVSRIIDCRVISTDGWSVVQMAQPVPGCGAAATAGAGGEKTFCPKKHRNSGTLLIQLSGTGAFLGQISSQFGTYSRKIRHIIGNAGTSTGIYVAYMNISQ
jgi:hypothetical protein